MIRISVSLECSVCCADSCGYILRLLFSILRVTRWKHSGDHGSSGLTNRSKKSRGKNRHGRASELIRFASDSKRGIRESKPRDSRTRLEFKRGIDLRAELFRATFIDVRDFTCCFCMVLWENRRVSLGKSFSSKIKLRNAHFLLGVFFQDL